MRILIVGNGGREHALLWKLRQDAPAALFFATRPNGGMLPWVEPVDIAPTDIEALARWVVARSVDLVVVGPEAPLAAGLTDRFRGKGIPVFGPTSAAARIEASKAFAKKLMARAGVPTAPFQVFRDFEAAKAYIRQRGAPLVVKASGLAAGKGVVVSDSVDEAVEAARAMLVEGRFGEAGKEVVVEDCLRGEELSVFAVTDGKNVLLMLPSQDHKRVGEGDTGPNTGGMGAYAPVSLATPALMERVKREILVPTLRALESEGSPFQGLLYAGLMLTADGPQVVEFNCRFGDPETQAVLPLLESSLLEPLATVAQGGSLAGMQLRWKPQAAVTVVLAARGYPGEYEVGQPVTIPAWVQEDSGTLVFHAGTRLTSEGLVTAGGRVLAVTGVAGTLSEAVRRSLLAADAIHFPGKYFRTDIGWRELARDERDRP